jgi:hypothetical protein
MSATTIATKNTMNHEIIEAAEVITNTRQFCGNEAEALREWQTENRKLTATERAAVWQLVDRNWRKDQIAAGVIVPLSNEERAKAYADIESGV